MAGGGEAVGADGVDEGLPRGGGEGEDGALGVLSDPKDGERYAEAGELIVTELVATAVLPPPRTPEHLLIDVLFEHSAPSGLRIEVLDTGLPDRGRPAPAVGRSPGLRLVRELASSCGHERTEGELVTNRFWVRVDPPPR
ncbi:hypothetical protein ACIGZJ_03195 [Kitasatospora sp. NPDC052868]|uniref:hypothetical protein n=1 Tax=Kitasatospora sp. NPDC052868 TaxID=3364060 RepID=UPI0037C599B6